MIRRTLAFAAIAVGLTPVQSFAADEAQSLERANQLVEESYAAMTADTSVQARNDALRAALETSFAFDFWEKFLIRNHKDSFSEAQLTEFRALLPGFLAKLYADQFGNGLEAKPEIKETRKARKDVLVRAAIPRANGKTLPVDWRVHEFEDRGHLVVDFMVGGTSFLILKRDEFNGVLDQKGPDALLDFMRKNAV
ncbi:MAG: ABC transporter substrate-binding protein [Pseudomonadota bacterium]